MPSAMKALRCAAIFLAFACSPAAWAQAGYAETKAKGDRFFDNREWASAAAMYNFLLAEKPDSPETYGRAIVATEMLGDSLRAMQLLSQAMTYSVPLDSVLARVRRYSFSVDEGSLYERFMLSAAREHPWMERPLDAYLLRYYAFRRNGPQMQAYARKMLRGYPGNPQFLMLLAEGCMICGDTAEAVHAWEQVLTKDPDNYLALLNLANYYEIAGNPADALPYFERAMSLHPTPYVAEAIEHCSPPKH